MCIKASRYGSERVQIGRIAAKDYMRSRGEARNVRKFIKRALPISRPLRFEIRRRGLLAGYAARSLRCFIRHLAAFPLFHDIPRGFISPNTELSRERSLR
jgi:hypothetical protein